MGGIGSGRQSQGNGRSTVESCKAIDVRWMRRAGYLEPGMRGQLFWKRNGKPSGDICWRAEPGRLVLSFRHRSPGKDWQAVEQSLPIVWTPCRFGGERPWFQCPGVVNGHHCGRRVAKVYADGPYFLCRHCYGLAYACQTEGPLDRLARRADKLRESLGGEPGFDALPPPKPKGMHWRNYQRRMNEIEHADCTIQAAFDGWLIDARARMRR